MFSLLLDEWIVDDVLDEEALEDDRDNEEAGDPSVITDSLKLEQKFDTSLSLILYFRARKISFEDQTIGKTDPVWADILLCERKCDMYLDAIHDWILQNRKSRSINEEKTILALKLYFFSSDRDSPETCSKWASLFFCQFFRSAQTKELLQFLAFNKQTWK